MITKKPGFVTTENFTLGLSHDRKLWELTMRFKDENGEEYTAVVTCSYHYGRNRAEDPYQFKKHLSSDSAGLVRIRSTQEMEAGYDVVKMNEGRRAADEWWKREEAGWVTPPFGDTPAYRANMVCDYMITKFKAILELGVFDIALTI